MPIASKTYVIPDLHGRFDLLELALAKIEADKPGTVVFTGDYVDRGPQSRQVIERLIAGSAIPGWKWVCLKGNHEDMMRQAFSKSAKLDWWLGNGGGATLLSYGQRVDQVADPSIIPQEHIDWIKGLPLYHVDNHRLYVHAGVDPDLSPDGQTEHTLTWKRYSAGDAGGFGPLHIVHGHDPFEDGPKLFAGRTDLGTGAFYTGRLVAGVFDDEIPGGPIDLIENVIAPR